MGSPTGTTIDRWRIARDGGPWGSQRARQIDAQGMPLMPPPTEAEWIDIINRGALKLGRWPYIPTPWYDHPMPLEVQP